MRDFELTGYLPIDGMRVLKLVDKFGEIMVWEMPEEEMAKLDHLLTVWINKYIEWTIAPCTCDGQPKHDDMPLTEED
jgi:hypothetical protein